MNLKALGLRFALGYLMSRASGSSRKDSALDSLVGSTIEQAKKDVTGFTDEIADVTESVISDLILAKATEIPTYDKVQDTEIQEFKEQVNNPNVGLTLPEIHKEVQEIKDGLDAAVNTLSKLERLKAGVIKRPQ